jgi:hypothetical protein
VGLLFGAFERDVARVVLLDARRPASFDALLSAATEVAPWLPDKVTFLRADIRRLPGAADEPQEEAAAEADERAARAHAPQHAPRAEADCFAGEVDATAAAAALLAALPAGGAGFVALHACGALTDACLGVAIRARGAVAALPCCYTGTAAGAPPALRRALGVSMAADVARVYRMEREGFTADFAAVPRAITPMNRALVAVPRQQPQRPSSA